MFFFPAFVLFSGIKPPSTKRRRFAPSSVGIFWNPCNPWESSLGLTNHNLVWSAGLSMVVSGSRKRW